MSITRCIINGHNTIVSNGVYTIHDYHADGVLFAGTCRRDTTPRDVFDKHFGRNPMDGRPVFGGTIVFITVDNFLIPLAVPIEYAVLDIAKYSQTQQGYELAYKTIDGKERVHSWPERPKVLYLDSTYISSAIHYTNCIHDESLLEEIRKQVAEGGHTSYYL